MAIACHYNLIKLKFGSKLMKIIYTESIENNEKKKFDSFLRTRALRETAKGNNLLSKTVQPA